MAHASVMRKSPISGISYVPYDAGIASIWNISVQRGTGPSRSGSTMAECVGHAHSSRDGSAISSIPLPADAALMTGGLEWRGACRHLRPRQIRTGIGSTAEPGSRLGLGASTSTRDVGMPFASCACFPPAPSARQYQCPWHAKHAPTAHPSCASHVPFGFPRVLHLVALGERRQVVQGDRAECGGVKRHRLLPSMVLANRFQGSGTAPFSTRSPSRCWQLAFTGSPAMRLIMATRTDRCRCA